MAVERVPAGVEHAALEPAVERRAASRRAPGPTSGPVDVRRRRAPRSPRDRRANAHAPRPNSAASRRRARRGWGVPVKARSSIAFLSGASARETDSCGTARFGAGRGRLRCAISSMPASSLSPLRRDPRSDLLRRRLLRRRALRCRLLRYRLARFRLRLLRRHRTPRSTPLTVRPELCGKRRALQSITTDRRRGDPGAIGRRPIVAVVALYRATGQGRPHGAAPTWRRRAPVWHSRFATQDR